MTDAMQHTSTKQYPECAEVETLRKAAGALIEQYDFGAGSCLGVMSDGKPCFKGSFLGKLEGLRAALAKAPTQR